MATAAQPDAASHVALQAYLTRSSCVHAELCQIDEHSLGSAGIDGVYRPCLDQRSYRLDDGPRVPSAAIVGGDVDHAFERTEALGEHQPRGCAGPEGYTDLLHLGHYLFGQQDKGSGPATSSDQQGTPAFDFETVAVRTPDPNLITVGLLAQCCGEGAHNGDGKRQGAVIHDAEGFLVQARQPDHDELAGLCRQGVVQC